MSLFTIALFLLLSPPDAFTRFSFCRENARGIFETQCVHLDPTGAGEVRFKRRGADEVQVALTLSQLGRDRFIEVLTGTNFLADGKNYESKRKVADLGRKHLILETPSGRREAEIFLEFVTSQWRHPRAVFRHPKMIMPIRVRVVQLYCLAEIGDRGIINQETMTFDLNNAIQYDRLSVPKRLDDLERELKANRIGDPRGLIPVLDKIDQDSRLVNYARSHARRLKEEIAAGK